MISAERFFAHWENKSKPFLVMLNIAALLVVGLLDYLTGTEIVLTLFYLIPVSWAAWFGGRTQGTFISFLSVLTIAVSSSMAGNKFSYSFIEVWNILMSFGFFFIFTVILTVLKKDFDERKRLIAELQKTLSDANQLSGLLPICASCKKIRDDKGNWKQMESYISDHSEALFSHDICPDCIRILYPEQYRDLFDKQEK